jgi:hypothetical protein
VYALSEVLHALHVQSKVAASRHNVIYFSIFLILPAALGPRVYSTSNRNEYQKQKINIAGE